MLLFAASAVPILANAYCGLPATPETVANRWNLDPVLLAALAAAAGVSLLAARKHASKMQSACQLTGWTVFALVVVSPLCALSVALFSARVVQHALIALLAAPLLASGLRHVLPRLGPMISAALFAAAMWIWHAPGIYEATFAGTAIYWAMHGTLLATAVLLWCALFQSPHPLNAVSAALLTSMQMSLLGALLTFAAFPLYSPHFATTAAWGLTQLDDQRLGGLIMWVPAGLVFTALSASPFVRLLRGEMQAAGVRA